MNRRKFLFHTGIAGAGLLGTGKAAPDLLRAGCVTTSDSKSHTGGKNRGI